MKNKALKLILALFLLNLCPAFALDVLPTTIYGKVTDQYGLSAEGVQVQAVWVDSNNAQQATLTSTLTISGAEAIGDRSMFGHFLFNKGDIQAKQGSQIKIYVNGYYYDSINSNPGGTVKVTTVMLISGDLSSGRIIFDPNTDNAADELPYSFYRSYEAYPVKSDISGAQYLKRTQYPNQKTYEQPVDEKGNPLVSPEITPDRIPNYGIAPSTTSSAKNPIEEPAINPASPSDAQKNPVQEDEIIISQGSLNRAFPSFQQPKEIKEPFLKSRLEKISNFSKTAYNFVASNMTTAMALIFALALSAAAYAKYRTIKKGRKKIKNRLYRELSAFGQTKVASLMSKEVITLKKESNILYALNVLVDRNLNSAVVVSNNKPVGILSEKNFLKKVYTKDRIDNLTVGDVMSSPLVAVHSNATLFQCMELMVKNNCRKLPVTGQGMLIGIVTGSDILKQISGFFSSNQIDAESIPNAGSIMARRFIEASDEIRLSDLCSYMIWNDIDHVVISSKSGNAKDAKIITTRDLIDEFYKNMYSMYKLKAKQLTLPDMVYVNPGMDIFEVMRLMLSHNYRRLPVIEKNRVVGVLTQIAMIGSFYDFIKDIMETIERNSIRKA